MNEILVPIDFNPPSIAAPEYAAQLAARTLAELIVVYADTFEPPAEFTAVQTENLAILAGGRTASARSRGDGHARARSVRAADARVGDGVRSRRNDGARAHDRSRRCGPDGSGRGVRH